MGAVLRVLSWAFGLGAFLFITLSLASGLLWIAEVIEEHSRSAKALGRRAIHSIIALHIILHLVDGLPLHLALLGIACHLVYLSNFTSSWPFISLTSPKFIASCLCVVVHHLLAYEYWRGDSFHRRPRHHSQRVPYRPAYDDGPSFLDVAAFFGICVWAVPFFLFLSLSANDNVIPMSADGRTSPPSTLPAPTKDDDSRRGAARPALSLDTTKGHATSITRPSIFKSLTLSLPNLRRSGTGGSHRNMDGLIATPMTPGFDLKSPPSPYYSTTPLASPVSEWPNSGGQSYFPTGDPPSASPPFSPALAPPTTGLAPPPYGSPRRGASSPGPYPPRKSGEEERPAGMAGSAMRRR